MRAKIVGAGLLVAGVALIFAGLSLGQEMSVLRKAIFVFLECIGIGLWRGCALWARRESAALCRYWRQFCTMPTSAAF